MSHRRGDQAYETKRTQAVYPTAKGTPASPPGYDAQDDYDDDEDARAEQFVRDAQADFQPSGQPIGQYMSDGGAAMLYVVVGFFCLVATAGLVLGWISLNWHVEGDRVTAYWTQHKIDEVDGNQILTQCEVDQKDGGCRSSTEQLLIEFDSNTLVNMFVHLFTYGPSSLATTLAITNINLETLIEAWVDMFIGGDFLNGEPIHWNAPASPMGSAECDNYTTTLDNPCMHVYAISLYEIRLSSPCTFDINNPPGVISCVLANMLISEHPICSQLVLAPGSNCTLLGDAETPGVCCIPFQGCVDLQTDPRHCGTCGNACGTFERCCAGACVDTSTGHFCENCVSNCTTGTSCTLVNPFASVAADFEYTCCVPPDVALATGEPCVDCCAPLNALGEPVELACLGGYDEIGCCIVEGEKAVQALAIATYDDDACCSGEKTGAGNICCARTGARSWTQQSLYCCDYDGSSDYGVATRVDSVDGPVVGAHLSCLFTGTALGPIEPIAGVFGIPGTELDASLATYGLTTADNYCKGNAGAHYDALDAWGPGNVYNGFQYCCRPPGFTCSSNDSCCYGDCPGGGGVCPENDASTPPLYAAGDGPCTTNSHCFTGNCNTTSALCEWPTKYNTQTSACRRDYDCRQTTLSAETICMYYVINALGGSSNNGHECCLPEGAACTATAECCDYESTRTCTGSVCV